MTTNALSHSKSSFNDSTYRILNFSSESVKSCCPAILTKPVIIIISAFGCDSNLEESLWRKEVWPTSSFTLSSFVLNIVSVVKVIILQIEIWGELCWDDASCWKYSLNSGVTLVKMLLLVWIIIVHSSKNKISLYLALLIEVINDWDVCLRHMSSLWDHIRQVSLEFLFICSIWSETLEIMLCSIWHA